MARYMGPYLDIYLHTDEQEGLCDALEDTRQTVQESHMFGRIFRELAHTAYPLAQRNPDRHRLIIKAYVQQTFRAFMQLNFKQEYKAQSGERKS